MTKFLKEDLEEHQVLIDAAEKVLKKLEKQKDEKMLMFNFSEEKSFTVLPESQGEESTSKTMRKESVENQDGSG